MKNIEKNIESENEVKNNIKVIQQASKDFGAKAIEEKKIIWKIFLRDLIRVFKNPILLIVMLAVIILPSLYSWFSVMANWDPYGKTSNIPVAVVIEDEPVHSDIAGDLNIGQTIKESLEQNNSLKWEFCDKETAMYNLEQGNVYFAIVVPQNFSRSLANIFEGQDVRDYTSFEVYVNERESASGTKVSDTGASTLEMQVNEKFVAAVSEVIAQKVIDASSSALNTGKNLTSTLSDRLILYSSTISSWNDTINKISSSCELTKDTLQSCSTTISEISNQTTNIRNSLSEAKSSISNCRDHINNLINDIKQKFPGLDILVELLTSLNSSLDNAIEAINSIDSVVFDVSSTLSKSQTLIDSSIKLIDNSSTMTTNIRATLTNSVDRLNSASSSLKSLADDKLGGIISKITSIDSASIGNFMGKPVVLQTEKINTINSYGTGVAPFFASVACWVAGFTLIAILRTEVDPYRKRKLSSKQAYLGRGALYMFFAFFAGAICCIGNLLIGITCENPVLYILTGSLACIVFVCIIYMLTACFKHIGKALALIFILLQIPGSSGMYPIELMPDIFRAIHPLLPFTYSINAMRETICNINVATYIFNICVLLAMGIGSTAIGIYCRSALLNINKLFDMQLSTTGIFGSDKYDHIAHSEDSEVKEAADKFIESQRKGLKGKLIKRGIKVNYENKRKKAIIILFILPFLFLATCSVIFNLFEVEINVKASMIFVWIAILFLCSCYVVLIEYTNAKFNKNNKENTTFKTTEAIENKTEAKYLWEM